MNCTTLIEGKQILRVVKKEKPDAKFQLKKIYYLVWT